MKNEKLRLLSFLLVVMTMLSAFSCAQSKAEKEVSDLDAQIESSMDYADKSGTGIDVRKKIISILNNNSAEAQASEKEKLSSISEELTATELHEVLSLAEKRKSDRVEAARIEKEKKDKEIAEAKSKAEILATTGSKGEKKLE